MAMAEVQVALQKILDELVDSGEEVGLQAAVYLDGSLVADCVSGVVGKDSTIPVEHNTLFTIYSCSKGVISTVVHQLAQRGLIDYEKPMAYYTAFAVVHVGCKPWIFLEERQQLSPCLT